MGSPRYSPEFKDEAVRQVIERGYSVREVAERVGVSSHSLYTWVRAVKPDGVDRQAQELQEAKSEVLRLRSELRRTAEERDILKKAAVVSMGRCNTRYSPDGNGGLCNGTTWKTGVERCSEARVMATMA